MQRHSSTLWLYCQNHVAVLVNSTAPMAAGDRPLITSASYPMQVNFLPPELLPLPGRLDMTLAPGKQNIGLPAVWKRALEADLARLVSVYRVQTLM